MMPSEIDLLRSLDEEPPTPSTVDVRRAISDGRRTRRVRRGAGYASAAAVTALAVAGASAFLSGRATDARPDAAGATGSPRTTASSGQKSAYTIPGTAGWSAPKATAPTSCTLKQLPVPDNEPMALVSGADPSGKYLVGRTYPKGGRFQAVIWHDGKVQKVMLPGDQEESLRDANSSGTAVGWSYQGKSESNTGPVPYVYRDGKVSKLPGVQYAEPAAINDAGAIVGVEDTGRSNADSVPLLWTSATSKAIRLPMPAGAKAGTASDIDEDGTVVGSIDRTKPYVWFADGSHRELPLPSANGKTATGARVFYVRNGWATGVADVGDPAAAGTKSLPSADRARGVKGPGGELWTVQWNIRTGETRVIAELPSGADAMNAQRWVTGITKEGRAALVTDAGTVALPGLTTQPSDPLATIANTLSDDGRTIAGQSDDATDTIQPVVWHCN